MFIDGSLLLYKRTGSRGIALPGTGEMQPRLQPSVPHRLGKYNGPTAASREKRHMQLRNIQRGAAIGLVLHLSLAGCAPLQSALSVQQPSSHILFIGNSFTFFNGGVDQQLRGFDPSIEAKQLAIGGYTLADHWNAGQALAEIRGGHWNYVVLQDQSQAPVTSPDEFTEYAGKFDEQVRAAGGQTVLFMTWERPDSIQYGVTTQGLADAYYAAGNRFGITVAPVGLAFAQALQQRPDLVLYVQDGHPTVEGTYLAGCVLYATIFAKSPAGLSYAPPGISNEDRAFLQQVAGQVSGY